MLSTSSLSEFVEVEEVLLTSSLTSENSNKSRSTTQETGETYTVAFSEGFQAQNAEIMETGTWLYQNYDVKEEYVNTRGKTVSNIIGDIDFICRIKTDTNLTQLFNLYSTCNSITIPEGSTILIEVTSMAGAMANSKIDSKTRSTKLQHKLNFYNRVFEKKNLDNFEKSTGIGISDSSKTFVLLVYNGAEYFDISQSFVSETFNSIVVHLSLQHCVKWSSSVENNKVRERAEKERAEKEKERAEKEKERAEKEKERAEKEKERERADRERERVNQMVRGLKTLGLTTIKISELATLTEEEVIAI